jgi:hypothetical protein
VANERREQRECTAEPGDRAGRAPADGRRVDERVDQQQHAAGRHHGSEQIEVLEAGAPALTGEQSQDPAEHSRASWIVW